MKRSRLILPCLLSGMLPALADGAVSAESAADQPRSELIIVSGIGGEDYYRELFHRWAAELVDTASGHLGLDEERITYLAEDPERDPQRIDVSSAREHVAAAIADIADRTAPGDQVMVVLLGHGTARDGRVLFNVPGKDFSPDDLNEWLAPLEGRRVAVVNASSASGPFLDGLARSGRVVITATANAGENQHARFGGHFVSAYSGLHADADKDGRVSLLEAFVSASRRVSRVYENERLMRTEHALLDDDGDGIGAQEPQRGGPDGVVAANWFLAPFSLGPAEGAAERLALEMEARRIVDEVESLKRDKGALARDEYEPLLEDLLVKLAFNRRALRSLRP